jgi:putative flippase GtrA
MANNFTFKSAKRELYRIAKFGVVGVTATLVHAITVFTLARIEIWPILFANLAAFLIAFTVTYSGNYLWTFEKPGQPVIALSKLILVSGIGFAVNNIALITTLSLFSWSEQVCGLVSACVVPLITFPASKLWVFRADQKSYR